MRMDLIQSGECLNRTKADPSPSKRELSCLTAFTLKHWFFLTDGLQIGTSAFPGSIAASSLWTPAGTLALGFWTWLPPQPYEPIPYNNLSNYICVCMCVCTCSLLILFLWRIVSKELYQDHIANKLQKKKFHPGLFPDHDLTNTTHRI